jgi:hypothetical protein
MCSAATTVGADEQPVMRLTTIRPVEAWHDLDRHLRDMMPDFARQAGLHSVWAGRQGPGDGDHRVVVTLWASDREQAAAVTVPEALERLGPAVPAIVETRIEVLRLRIRERFPRDRPMRIMRVYRGRTRPDELEPYLSEARAGVLIDGSREDGPGALACGIERAVDRPDGFVTASLWADWSCIEAATGGDVRHPLLTRNTARLVAGEPAHFELITALDGPQAEPRVHTQAQGTQAAVRP